MSTLLNKSYLVKVSTKGEGGQKCPKFCLRGLFTAPYRNKTLFFIFLEYISMYRIVLLIVARIILVILDDC